MLTGRSRAHVVEVEGPGCTLHRDVVQPFLRLRAAAATAGINLRAASSFRDFDRQLFIWNAKFRGERPVLDRQGRAVPMATLDTAARIEAILVWSALPGASRHHWGTDLDVYDAAAMPDPSRLQLVPEEYAENGPFARLAEWLAEHLADYGFFRPYAPRSAAVAAAGVSPEPWHLSFAPLAEKFRAALSPALLAETLRGAPLEGREVVIARLEDIHRRYVMDITPPCARSLGFELGDHRRMV